jgi:hypothetical protein
LVVSHKQVFYCFIVGPADYMGRRLNDKKWLQFSFVGCISFLAVSVYMIMDATSNRRCMDSLGRPPLLLYLLCTKAAMYGFGVISTSVAIADRFERRDAINVSEC